MRDAFLISCLSLLALVAIVVVLLERARRRQEARDADIREEIKARFRGIL